MNIKTVLFDLDGTLIDSLPLIKTTYHKVFQELDIPWGNAEVMNSVGLPLVQIAKTFAGEERHIEFFKLYQHYYALEHDNLTRAFPGTLEMLESLRQAGCRLGIVTSKSRGVAMRSAEYVNIARYMEVFIGAEDVHQHKPQPEPIIKALTLLDAPASTAAYVGDSPFDVMAAKAADVISVGVTWGMSKREEISRHSPDIILGSWKELSTALNLTD